MYYNSSEVLIGQLTQLCLLSVLVGLLPAAIAYNKGHGFFKWWVFGAAIFILALPAAILIKPDTETLESRQLQQGMVKCPYCLELIKKGARICKHCGRTIQTEAVDAQPVASGGETPDNKD